MIRFTTRAAGFAAASALALAGAAQADVIDINITGALNEPSLRLEGGQWLEGRDWGWQAQQPNALAWANEDWIGGAPVDLNVQVVTDGVDPDVMITKTLQNNTGFIWTAFNIDLFRTAGFGPIMTLPGSVSSTRFASNMVTNFGSGDSSISYFNGAVVPGDTVTFMFTFNIPGDVSFRMLQTPIPTPGALALLGLGAAGLLRRRR